MNQIERRIANLRAWIAEHPSLRYEADDSRDSIYGPRNTLSKPNYVFPLSKMEWTAILAMGLAALAAIALLFVWSIQGTG